MTRTAYSLDLQRRVEELADHADARQHSERLSNGAGRSWVCVPVSGVIDAIEAADLSAAPPVVDRERLRGDIIGLVAPALPPVDDEGNLSAEVAEGIADAILAATRSNAELRAATKALVDGARVPPGESPTSGVASVPLWALLVLGAALGDIE